MAMRKLTKMRKRHMSYGMDIGLTWPIFVLGAVECLADD